MSNNFQQKGKSLSTSGFALMTALLFFVVGGTIILAGIATAVTGEVKTVRNESDSKQVYFTSESGLEDAIYRIKTGKILGTTGSLVIDSTSASVSVATDADESKVVESTGEKNGLVRLTEALLDTTFSVSFPFALQGGSDGVDLSSCTITGDAYSAGSIRGGNQCTISGAAIASGKTETILDQDNEASTSNPPSEVNFGDSLDTQDIAQSFIASTKASLDTINLLVRKMGNPSSASIKITTDDNGMPSFNILTTGGLASSDVPSSYSTRWMNISFASNPLLTPGSKYWIVLDANPNASNYYVAAATINTYSGSLLLGRYNTLWTDLTPPNQDFYLKISLKTTEDGISGVNSQNNLVVGSAYAHSVKYVTSLGPIYCQESISNNKECDTSRADPMPQPFPVTDSTISQWKAIAAAGTSFSDGYTVDSSGATLGPTKIVGDLTVGDGGTLLVSGVIWVTGNVDIADGSTVSPLNSAKSYVIIADGNIHVSGGATVGQSGEHIMLLSLSAADQAISVESGSHAAVLVASRGGVLVTGGARVNAVASKHVTVSGGAQVSYDPLVSNLHITGGSPVATYRIKSWNETQ